MTALVALLLMLEKPEAFISDAFYPPERQILPIFSWSVDQKLNGGLCLALISLMTKMYGAYKSRPSTFMGRTNYATF